MRVLLLIVTLLLMCSVESMAQKRSYAQYPFIIITGDTIQSLPAFTDEEFYSRSSGVVFAVNKTNIRTDDEFIQLYRNEVLPMINDGHYQLRKVFIRGAASPEGPYENNRRLGKARSAALLTELRRGLENQYLETDAEINSITEDYGYLCILMKEGGDEDYDKVKAIYDNCGGDELCCKKRLMAFDKGRLWKRLLKEYFPRLRAARLVLWFSEPDEEHAPERKIQVENMMANVDICTEGKVVTPVDFPNVLPQIDIPQEYTRRHLIAARTNLLHDFFYMPSVGWSPSPNIQFEYYPLDGHYTYNIGMTWGTHRHWERQEFFQMRDFQLELRRYFRGGGEFMGPYLGAFLEGNVYGIGLGKEDGWEGEGGGGGLTVGYVLPLNKKKNLRLEFMAAAGFYRTYYDPYVYGNPVTGTEDGKYYYDYLGTASAFKKRNHVMTWRGPTNLGIQLTYDIIYRKKKPRNP